MSGRWETTRLAGHAVDVFTPETARDDAVLLYLPAADERASHRKSLIEALSQFPLPAVSPAVSGTWWLDLVEPAFDAALPALRWLTDHVVPFIDKTFGVRPPAVRLLGCEVGGQGVLQLAYRRPREFPVVAAIDPAIDFHELFGSGTPLDELFATREAARQQTALLRMQGVGWPRRQLLLADRRNAWFDGADRLDMKLRSMGIPLTSDFSTSSAGDGTAFFDRHVARAVEFLVNDRTLPVVSG
jgi:hypothetical protein